MKIISAEFVGGAKFVDKLPSPGFPEIAIIGRSNVGKSTFINRLSERSKLARTSSTPGRTQAINIFSVALGGGSGKPKKLAIADLPGFGFAKLSKAEREFLSKLCVDYITTREPLRAICLLNDCRRDPQEDERAVQELGFKSDVGILVVLTKSDKLKKQELTKRKAAIAKLYGLEAEDVICVDHDSSLNHVWNRMLALIE